MDKYEHTAQHCVEDMKSGARGKGQVFFNMLFNLIRGNFPKLSYKEAIDKTGKYITKEIYRGE